MFCNVMNSQETAGHQNAGHENAGHENAGHDGARTEAIAMFTLLAQLDGRHVRLEPLQPWHAAGLAEAAAGDPALYQLSAVPQGEAAAVEYVGAALAERDAGTSAPLAVLRVADGAVIGSTRFWDLVWWPWPQG